MDITGVHVSIVAVQWIIVEASIPVVPHKVCQTSKCY